MKILLVLLLFSCISKAQIYYAGAVHGNYSDIIPDTLIDCLHPLHFTSATESFNIDINNDFIDDFKIISNAKAGLNHGILDIKIKPLNSNSLIRFGRIDSAMSYGGGWYVNEVAKPLAYGDSINSNNAVWKTTLQCISDRGGMSGFYRNIIDFVSTADRYIGIKWQDSTETKYGWIRVYCPNFQSCFIKDFSISDKCFQVAAANFTSDTVCFHGITTLMDSSIITAGIDSLNSWNWDFNGDGVYDNTSQNPAHAFSSGLNSVTLKVGSNMGCTDSITKQVYVKPLPSVNFSYAPQSICANDTIAFTGLSTDSILNYMWDFNNDSVIDINTQSSNTTYSFPLTGSYSVNLVVNSVDGCSNNKTQIIDVSCTNAIEEKDNGYNIEIFPNPATNTINITNINRKTNLYLYDMPGKLVLVKETESDTALDVSSLRQGIYTLVSESSGKRAFNKVVIVK